MGLTHRQQWLRKNKLEDRSYGLTELAKISKTPLKTLQEIFNRGVGAHKTQLSSVRIKKTFEKGVVAPAFMKLSKEQWAYARVYSWLNGSKKHDMDLR
jgi:hypothetical protein